MWVAEMLQAPFGVHVRYGCSPVLEIAIFSHITLSGNATIGPVQYFFAFGCFVQFFLVVFG